MSVTLLDEVQQSSPYEKNKRRSPVYNFFSEVAANDFEPWRRIMQCRHCTMKITAKSSNLEKHLQSTHKAEYKRFLLVKGSGNQEIKTDMVANSEQGGIEEESLDTEESLDGDGQSKKLEKSKRRSPVYSYFSEVDANDCKPWRRIMQCRYCPTKILAKSSNLEKHLQSTHKEEYKQFLLVKASGSHEIKADTVCAPEPEQGGRIGEDSFETEELVDDDGQSKKIKLELNEFRANNPGDKLYQSSPYDRNKRRSPIYNFFTTTPKPNRMQCHYCSIEITAKSTNLEKHLRTSHPTEYEGFLVLKASASSTNFASVKRKRESDSESDREDSQEESFETKEFNVDNGQSRAIKLEAEEFRVISEDNPEFIGVPGQPSQSQRFCISGNGHFASMSELLKEEKFIKAVFPEFAGKTKLQLIDEIRLLRDKNRIYKDTIDKFLDN